MVNINRFERFSKIINQICKELKKIKYMHMSKYGLGSIHAMCVISLGETPGQTAGELMSGEEIDKAQMSRVIKDLCEKNYIKPVEGQKQKYKIKYELTETGNQIATEVRQKAMDIVKFVDEGIPEENIMVMYFTLERLCNNIIKAQDKFER
ncbi:MAG: MarR family winged helix-turn-helix transcriptional regulator [Lachnospiraceae bacterium]